MAAGAPVLTDELRHKFCGIHAQHRDFGMLMSGNKARELLAASGLPVTTLGQVWALSDQDRDGNLSADEFCTAMLLITSIKKNPGFVLPSQMPSPAAALSAGPAFDAPGLGAPPQQQQEASFAPVPVSQPPLFGAPAAPSAGASSSFPGGPPPIASPPRGGAQAAAPPQQQAEPSFGFPSAGIPPAPATAAATDAPSFAPSFDLPAAAAAAAPVPAAPAAAAFPDAASFNPSFPGGPPAICSPAKPDPVFPPMSMPNPGQRTGGAPGGLPPAFPMPDGAGVGGISVQQQQAPPQQGFGGPTGGGWGQQAAMASSSSPAVEELNRREDRIRQSILRIVDGMRQAQDGLDASVANFEERKKHVDALDKRERDLKDLRDQQEMEKTHLAQLIQRAEEVMAGTESGNEKLSSNVDRVGAELERLRSEEAAVSSRVQGGLQRAEEASQCLEAQKEELARAKELIHEGNHAIAELERTCDTLASKNLSLQDEFASQDRLLASISGDVQAHVSRRAALEASIAELEGRLGASGAKIAGCHIEVTTQRAAVQELVTKESELKRDLHGCDEQMGSVASKAAAGELDECTTALAEARRHLARFSEVSARVLAGKAPTQTQSPPQASNVTTAPSALTDMFGAAVPEIPTAAPEDAAAEKPATAEDSLFGAAPAFPAAAAADKAGPTPPSASDPSSEDAWFGGGGGDAQKSSASNSPTMELFGMTGAAPSGDALFGAAQPAAATATATATDSSPTLALFGKAGADAAPAAGSDVQLFGAEPTFPAAPAQAATTTATATASSPTLALFGKTDAAAPKESDDALFGAAPAFPAVEPKQSSDALFGEAPAFPSNDNLFGDAPAAVDAPFGETDGFAAAPFGETAQADAAPSGENTLFGAEAAPKAPESNSPTMELFGMTAAAPSGDALFGAAQPATSSSPTLALFGKTDADAAPVPVAAPKEGDDALFGAAPAFPAVAAEAEPKQASDALFGDTPAFPSNDALFDAAPAAPAAAADSGFGQPATPGTGTGTGTGTAPAGDFDANWDDGWKASPGGGGEDEGWNAEFGTPSPMQNKGAAVPATTGAAAAAPVAPPKTEEWGFGNAEEDGEWFD